MGFRQRLAENPERTPCVVSFAPRTAASRSGFARPHLPAAPRARVLRGQAPAPRVGAPPERVLLLDAIRETPPPPLRERATPGACPRSGNLQGGKAQGASQGGAPAPPPAAHRGPASCTRMTTHPGVQGERCKGQRRRTRVEGAAMPSPKENSCRLVHR